VNSLRIAAGVELASLAVLFANLFTAHWPAVSSLAGPIHGCAYLLVIILTGRQSRSARIRATAVIPGIGGLLVLRQLGPSGEHGAAVDVLDRARRP
jgi:hypothetical protein